MPIAITQNNIPVVLCQYRDWPMPVPFIFGRLSGRYATGQTSCRGRCAHQEGVCARILINLDKCLDIPATLIYQKGL